MAKEAEILQYSIEREKAGKAKVSWDSFFGPFFAEKQTVLFEAFQVAEIRDTEGLIGIKMQLNALNSLKDEMLGYIETGKLAEISLNQHEATQKDAKKELDDG